MSDNGHHGSITVHRISDIDDPRLAGFIATYQDVFAGPPYFEKYAEQEVVDNVWKPHIGHGIVLATNSTGMVVGLACCHSVVAETEPSIRDYILSRPEVPSLFDPSRTIFMSELAVREQYRRRGLGKRFIIERFAWGREHGFESYCTRTADRSSNSRALYERIGAKLAPFVQDVSSGGVESASKARIYLYGSIAEALDLHWND